MADRPRHARVVIAARLPAGTPQGVAGAIAPTLRTADVAPDRNPLVCKDLEWIEGVDVLGQPVAHAFALGFERPEQAIPDDQDAAVVAVEVQRN